jgi:HEPN domain-containing protein
MQRDEARLSDTRAWLRRAERDLKSAEHALTAPEPLREDAVFHCQQAAEKAFKAFLTWHDVPFRKTHSLEELGRQCSSIAPALRTLVDEAAPLSEYAWRFRYPGPADAPSPEETAEALAVASRVTAAIRDRLPPEARREA